MLPKRIGNPKTMDSRLTFRIILLFAFLTFPGAFSNSAGPLFPPVEIHTGPETGQTIPPFDASDKNGRKQTFETIRGPRGALIVFFRSADW